MEKMSNAKAIQEFFQQGWRTARDDGGTASSVYR